jgi:hypothetical protein
VHVVPSSLHTTTSTVPGFGVKPASVSVEPLSTVLAPPVFAVPPVAAAPPEDVEPPDAVEPPEDAVEPPEDAVEPPEEGVPPAAAPPLPAASPPVPGWAPVLTGSSVFESLLHAVALKQPTTLRPSNKDL